MASAICADHEVPGLKSSLSNQTVRPAARASGALSSRRFSSRAASVSAPEWLRKMKGWIGGIAARPSSLDGEAASRGRQRVRARPTG